MSSPRIAVLVLWLVILSSFLVSDSALASVGRALAGLLVVAHILECLIFLPRLRRAPGSLATHLAQTLVFGIVHVRELPRASS